jgi:hypothetical protein
MSDEKIFADGFIAKRSDKAPDFVTCSLSIKVGEAVAFLQQHAKEGWVNLQVKQSKNGKYYVELDTWQPTQGESAKQGMAQAKKAAETQYPGRTPSGDPSFDDLDQIPF